MHKFRSANPQVITAFPMPPSFTGYHAAAFPNHAPSLHSMLLALERRGFLQHLPGQARSTTLLVQLKTLPFLNRIPR